MSKTQSRQMSYAERLAFKVLRYVSPKLPRPAYVVLGRTLHFFTIPFFARQVAGVLRVRVALVHDSKVFVVKNWYGNGSWGLPGGGIEQGETDVQGLVRELNEELGFEVNMADLVNSKTYDYEGKLWGSLIPCRVFIVSVGSKPEFTVNTYELVGQGWVEISKLPKSNEFAGIAS